jgi:hypothetical protein
MGIKHCKEWEKRISHEFLFQATLELEQGLPVAPFMLKYDMLSRIENQNHFMTFFAYPQWKAIVEMFPILEPRFNQLVRALSSLVLRGVVGEDGVLYGCIRGKPPKGKEALLGADSNVGCVLWATRRKTTSSTSIFSKRRWRRTRTSRIRGGTK